MTRASKPIGDLEYDKFDGDDTGTVKVKEQSAINYTEFQNEQLLHLKTIIRLLEKNNELLNQFFDGDDFDDSDSLGWDNTL